jgi:two-component system alkaline phosphatase synthesis response regulator PhoP
MDYIALIVDDDHPTLLFLEQVLRPLNIRVMQAEDGAQAIAILENHTPIILFLDMLMPTMSGMDVLEYIRRTPRLNNLFVAVVSAHSYFEPSPTLGRANAYHVKPIRPKDIREETQYAISRQAPH